MPGRVVFEHVVAALVHGSGYERIASLGCSDRTIRRRLAEWADLGLAEALHAAALRAYDQIIGLELGHVAVDGCPTKAPCGGERAGPSPVDRRKGGLKRSVASDGHGIPLGIVSAGANRHDSPLLAPTLQAASRQLDHVLPADRVQRSDGPAAGPAQPRSRARQRLGIHRRGRRQRGTFGSSGCLKTNHPGTWNRSGEG